MSGMTFTQFIAEARYSSRELGLDLAPMLGDIAGACVSIADAINRGALTGNMGSLASENIQGEVQKALDLITNDIFLEANQWRGFMAGMASEEMEDPYVIPEKYRNKGDAKHGKYLMLFDPLDGSSNVNANITVGTIFSILRCPEGVTSPALEDFLQAGTEQVCAGYALYGSSTMLVLTMGNGVNGFTLDEKTGEFLLTHPDIRIPQDTNEFAINMSNYRFWEEPAQRYIDECLQGREGIRKKDFNMRWVGSMVAEVHRILIRGGVYLYPIDSKTEKQGGRLRLMYELNPMGFIVEQAGGTASTGSQRIMEIKPSSLHQRVPVAMGSKNEVDILISYYKR